MKCQYQYDNLREKEMKKQKEKELQKQKKKKMITFKNINQKKRWL